MSEDTIPASEETEFDFSGDSVVESKELTWQITKVEIKHTDGDNGKGVQHVFTFESDDFPFPIVIRQFVEYEPTDPDKNTDWVKRSRGVLKQISKAALGEPKYSLNPEAANYIVGRYVKATTKENQDGFPTLGRFKKVG